MTKEVEIRQTVQVTVDESKFTPEFMQSFRDSFFDLYSVEDHIEHLGYLHAGNFIDQSSFVEGYGYISEFGVEFEDMDYEVEVL